MGGIGDEVQTLRRVFDPWPCVEAGRETLNASAHPLGKEVIPAGVVLVRRLVTAQFAHHITRAQVLDAALSGHFLRTIPINRSPGHLDSTLTSITGFFPDGVVSGGIIHANDAVAQQALAAVCLPPAALQPQRHQRRAAGRGVLAGGQFGHAGGGLCL